MSIQILKIKSFKIKIGKINVIQDSLHASKKNEICLKYFKTLSYERAFFLNNIDQLSLLEILYSFFNINLKKIYFYN